MTGPSKELFIEVFGRTDLGQKREHNEDSFLVADLTEGLRSLKPEVRKHRIGHGGSLLVVCDGMGGAAAGEVASQTAVDTIFTEMYLPGHKAFCREFASRMNDALLKANQRILKMSRQDATRNGMGTTCSAAGIVDGHLVIGQIGDSRVYVLRGNQIVQVTRDQSLLNQLLDSGQIKEADIPSFEHTNVILQALGVMENIQVVFTQVELQEKDRVLVCSDGLTSVVPDEMILQIIQQSPDPVASCKSLTEHANAAGGPDNITVIVAVMGSSGISSADTKRPVVVSHGLFDQPPADMETKPTRKIKTETAPSPPQEEPPDSRIYPKIRTTQSYAAVPFRPPEDTPSTVKRPEAAPAAAKDAGPPEQRSDAPAKAQAVPPSSPLAPLVPEPPRTAPGTGPLPIVQKPVDAAEQPRVGEPREPETANRPLSEKPAEQVSNGEKVEKRGESRKTGQAVRLTADHKVIARKPDKGDRVYSVVSMIIITVIIVAALAGGIYISRRSSREKEANRKNEVVVPRKHKSRRPSRVSAEPRRDGAVEKTSEKSDAGEVRKKATVTPGIRASSAKRPAPMQPVAVKTVAPGKRDGGALPVRKPDAGVKAPIVNPPATPPLPGARDAGTKAARPGRPEIAPSPAREKEPERSVPPPPGASKRTIDVVSKPLADSEGLASRRKPR